MAASLNPTTINSVAQRAAGGPGIDYNQVSHAAGTDSGSAGGSSGSSSSGFNSIDQQLSQLDQQWQQSQAHLNQIRNSGGMGQTVGDAAYQNAYNQYQQQRQQLLNQGQQAGMSQFNQMTQDVSGQLAQVAQNPDQNLANNYYEQAAAPIDTNFYNQANSVSAYLSRQGLGSSGMNLASHSGLEQNRSALEGQAKLQATNMAIEKQRQELLDKFSTQAMAMQPNLQKYGIDTSYAIAQMQVQAQLQILQQQLDAQSSAGLGQLTGQLGGSLLGNSSLFNGSGGAAAAAGTTSGVGPIPASEAPMLIAG